MADPTTVREWLKKAIQMAGQLDTDAPTLSSWSWFAENAQKALDDSERCKDAEMTRITEMAERED